MYSEGIINKGLVDQKHSIKINGNAFNNLRHVDTDLLSKTLQDCKHFNAVID